MIYLKNFTLLDEKQEFGILLEDRRTIYNNNYPLGLLSSKQFKTIDFENITIFYGGNGSGKTTLINIISEKLGASKKNILNKGNLFDLYVKRCTCEMSFNNPYEIKLVTSDDVFDYLLNIRSINSGVNNTKDRLSKEYLNNRYNSFDNSLDNYNEIKNNYEAKTKSMSQYIRARLVNNNIIEQSNGESALMFWQQEIKEDAIYILDEPENSLSAENQVKLKKFIEDSARFYNCQFIISTHSPFLLNLSEAKIYDLDDIPVTTKNWTELSNVKTYYNFFKEHENEFKN